MRRLVKGLGYSTLAVGSLGGYAYVATRPASDAVGKCPGPELSAEQWNAQQDAATLAKNFSSLQNLRQCSLAFYWLYGCPYCARVKACLDYLDVPYTPVLVDPVNFAELNPMPYRACPQLQLGQPTGVEFQVSDKYPVTKLGPMVADSEAILQKLAGAANINLAEPAIARRREWIGRDVARLVFVVGSSSYGRAYALMPWVTPTKYHGFIFRAGGAVPLWLLSKYKITGRVVDHYMTDASAPKDVAAIVREAVESKTALNVDRVLTMELKTFFDETSPFHGGNKPDIVDVELYGLLRSQERHVPISDCVTAAGLGPWYANMQKAVPSAALTDRIGL